MKKSRTDSDTDMDLLKTVEKKRRNYMRSHLVSSTPTNAMSKAKARIDFQFDSDCLELAQQHSTPYHVKNNKIVNSTPVNHKHGNSFRSIKDLTKTSLE